MFEQTTVRNLILYGAKELKNITNIPQKEAYILLGFVLKKDRLTLLREENCKVTEPESKIFYTYLEQRKKYKPIEYITNSASFYGFDFFVKEGVLIPRPESEIIIDKVLEISKNFNPKSSIKIADIGTGSGILAVTLAKFLDTTNFEFSAIDISFEALAVAKENARKFGIENYIKFIQNDLLENLNDSFDIVVSNPPYIKNNYKIDKNLEFEPKIALFGGEEGDEILKRLIVQSIEKKVKFLICEMGFDQKKSIETFLENYKYNINYYQFYQDLAGFDRGFVIYFKIITKSSQIVADYCRIKNKN